VSIRIDSSASSADTITIDAGVNVSFPATGPGVITCSPGTTYTFICFVTDVWTRM
jgi:hypothetical protein